MNDEEDQTTNAVVKFCPICGDQMHKETMYGALWWVCNDLECGFIELIE
ncbi:hypothetical protein [Yersinia intermedia]|uniref:Uncharacterized protein n=1 Tax=Yersinia intermedia TaxID=631 RepID=A0A0T9LRQ5_YERIN|nr:hypothetical protein [Yersinia intermedia]CNF18060.1 Uncharacterised protein [Yersinia intermedia]